MKTLKNHTILYDAVCPMCTLYTKAFVATGMLDKEGRETYQSMPEAYKHIVDPVRCVNEIALVDKSAGTVHYGIRSLLIIIGHALPTLNPLFKWKPFVWCMNKIYRLISYNRRVIMPVRLGGNHQFYHDPTIHLGYRAAYLILAWLLTVALLNAYSQRLLPLVPPSTFSREAIICGGQMVWQGVVVYWLNKRRLMDYLGNVMTISLAGSGLLYLSMGVADLLQVAQPIIYLGVFALVVGLMLMEHIRRTRLLQLSVLVTVSWVLYRVVVLFFILK